MAVRLLILGTEARHHYIRSEIPDDPHDVSKNFVVIPEAHCLFSRFRKSEIGCSREELLRMVDASGIQQFLCSNNAEPLAQFRADQILAAVPARHRKISGVVERTVRPERHQVCVFVIRMRRDVKNAAKHVELFQCQLHLAPIHLFRRQQRRHVGAICRASDGEDREQDCCAPSVPSVAAVCDRRSRAAMAHYRQRRTFQ
jgi:hypothetical protein